jgi:hypothetical protein
MFPVGRKVHNGNSGLYVLPRARRGLPIEGIMPDDSLALRICARGLCTVLVCLGLVSLARPLLGYSVITHQAIIDAEWESLIKPLLLERFPYATAEELRTAEAYAYGGSVIQDLGYYPIGKAFFSHLTHYVRSGDFVRSLFVESRDLDDYAFALGALSHYAADIDGHYLAVNRSVPLLYPRLRKKYGDRITWEESPWAHSLTEFGFDTLEVVDRHVAPQKYHDAIGFQVPRSLLERAFQRTYGLELKNQTLSVRLRLALYRLAAAQVVPEMSEVAWALRRRQLEARARSLHHRQLYHLPYQSYAAWRMFYVKPGVGDKLTAFFFRLLPKFGRLSAFDFHAPTVRTEQMFANSLKATVEDYTSEVKAVQAGQFVRSNVDLDTGQTTRPGEYVYCDRTYAQLLHKLERRRFAGVSPALRENLLDFFEGSAENSLKKKNRQWRRILRELGELKASSASPEISPTTPVKAPAANSPRQP